MVMAISHGQKESGDETEVGRGRGVQKLLPENHGVGSQERYPGPRDQARPAAGSRRPGAGGEDTNAARGRHHVRGGRHLLDWRDVRGGVLIVRSRSVMAVVLDTCAWLWFCSNRGKLSKAARETIQREERRNGLVVSVFSAWEVAKLVEKGKLQFAIPCRD